jgi:hypothetical protein
MVSRWCKHLVSVGIVEREKRDEDEGKEADGDLRGGFFFLRYLCDGARSVAFFAEQAMEHLALSTGMRWKI